MGRLSVRMAGFLLIGGKAVAGDRRPPTLNFYPIQTPVKSSINIILPTSIISSNFMLIDTDKLLLIYG